MNVVEMRWDGDQWVPRQAIVCPVKEQKYYFGFSCPHKVTKGEYVTHDAKYICKKCCEELPESEKEFVGKSKREI